jgi:hypothetical protein
MINENENLAKFADKIAPKITVIEGTLSFIALIGLMLKISGIPQGGILILLSLSAISLVYFLSAYQTHEAETPAMTRFLHKLLFWSASICVIGILFRLQSFAGYNTMLLVGCISLSLGLIFNFFSKVYLDRKILIRTIIILAVGISLYITPSEKLKELKIINSTEMVNKN